MTDLRTSLLRAEQVPPDLSRSRRLDIQGLRAIAVLGVVINHADADWLPGGYIGVDVFFVISGFLITGQLLRRIEQHGRPRLSSFYAKRIRRLLPASVLVLVATLIACRLLLPPLTMLIVAKDAIATAVYGSNMWFAYNGTNYLANSSPSVFQHYWSLALEEQFYLFWPLILLAAHRAFRSRRALTITVAALAVLSFALCMFLTDYKQPWAFFTLPARAWELAVGGLIALGAARASRLNPSAAAALGWAGLIGILVSLVTFNEQTSFPGYAVALPVLSTAAVITAGMNYVAAGPERALNNGIFQWVGNRSYSLYLWHWPILLIPAMRWGTPNAVELLGLIALAMLLSALSYRFVEEPLRNAAPLRRPKWRTYGFGAALTALAVAGALAASATVGPLNAGRPADPLTAAQVQAGIPAPSFVPSNLAPSLRGATDDNPVVYADGCHVDFSATAPERCVYGNGNGPKVALVGDSHAAQWFPALDAAVEQADGSLLSLTKSACPSYDVTVFNHSLGREYRECDEWRGAALAMVSDFEPDVVVLSNFGSGYRDEVEGDAAGFLGQWGAGLVETASALTGDERRVVVLGDTPRWEETVNLCLSSHLDAPETCAGDPDVLLYGDIAAAERVAAEEAGVEFVDTARWLCGSQCQPIAGNTLVYRDESHMTATFSTLLAPVLADATGIS
jgi:peptidoglycan/LPS O-acetylase OafA/YrhL